MKQFAIVLLLLVLASSAGFSQMTDLANVNATTVKSSFTGPDSLRPWRNDQGVRSVWVTKDCNKNGKPEILATDYANGGRIHVFEYAAPNKMELIWSTPWFYSSNPNSTPRWARDGDLDGDGNREIIFPVGGRYTGKVVVFEWDPVGQTFGTVPAIELPSNQFAATLGATANVRMDRETGTVEDFDGDLKDELICAFQTNKVYILGIQGDIPGFGAWQVEGGDPAVHAENGFSPGSWWQSLLVDVNGDTKKEIVSHYWNMYGFWSIQPLGPDSYRYPRPAADSLVLPTRVKNAYHEYMMSPNDAVAYMGTQPVDVDGDGKQEIAGLLYIGGTPAFDYQPCLVSLSRQDTGVYVWKDSSQFGIIGNNLWEVAGKTTGSFWGIGAYDFNGNGKQELLLGGTAPYQVVAMEYKGTGSVLDKANYNNSIYYAGGTGIYLTITYKDSAGVKKDTVRSESPFISKMFSGVDLNGNGKKELVASYQNLSDSLTQTWQRWDVTQAKYVNDSTKGVNGVQKVSNPSCLNIKVLEYTGATFVELPFEVVTPEQYVLEQNYPNPFNPSTTIRFSLPVDKRISLTVYDMMGREVKRLISDEDLSQGAHSATWDGTNNAGQSVSSGTYVYTLKYGAFTRSAKMMLLK